VRADGEEGAPPGDRVGAHDGVDGGEGGADVFGRAAGVGVDLEAAAVGDGVEAGLGEGCGKGGEEGLVGGGEAVVELVARGPESVCGELGWVCEADVLQGTKVVARWVV
jgi:hypothetical protein